MDLRQLRHFLALANHLNFTRAADAACITQSAFSRSIQGLESELGGALVERGSRGVVLTQKGLLLRVRATRLLAEASTLREEMTASDNRGQPSRLGLGVGPLVAAQLLPQALASFLDQAPQTLLDVRVDKPSTLLSLLDDGVISVVVADLRHMEIDTRYLARPLRLRHFGLFCRAGHPLRLQPPPAFAELSAYPRVAAMLPIELRALLQEQWGTPGPALNLETQHNDLLPKLVEGSDSIGIAQLEVIDPLVASGAFHRLRCVDEPPLMRDGGACFVIVQRTDQPLAATARAMIDALLDADQVADPAALQPVYAVARQLAL